VSEFSLNSDINEIISRIAPVAKDFSGKTICLTGGRGFLGRYFSEVFVSLNKEVLNNPVKLIVLDNLITAGDAGDYFPSTDNAEFINYDVIEPFDYGGEVDFVIHAAGIASPYYYRAFPLETLDVAITGTRNMLELAKLKGAQFIFFSSSEVYGDPDAKHVPMAESYRGNVSTQGPRACYDESKRAGETLCYIFHTNYGIHTNTIRPFNVYGPGMQENDYRVLPNFASRIQAGLPLKVYGDGRQTRTFCYVTDAIIGSLLVMLRGVPGEAYNIGNPFPELSMLDLVKRIRSISEDQIEYNLMEYPDSYPGDEPMRRCPDIRKAILQLGFEPQIDIDEGLKRFFSWTNEVYTGQH